MYIYIYIYILLGSCVISVFLDFFKVRTYINKNELTFRGLALYVGVLYYMLGSWSVLDLYFEFMDLYLGA